MRVAFLALTILLLAPLALAHGGPTTVEYNLGLHIAGTAEPAVCVATPLRLYNVPQHVGGACDIHVGHPEHTSVTAHADDVSGATFYWRMVDDAGAVCAQGEFVGSIVIGAPLDCARISVYAPIGSQSGTITVVG